MRQLKNENFLLTLFSSQFQIDKLKFAVRGSKHSILIATLKPLVTGLIKKGIATAIQEGIRSGLVQLDSQLADISERLEKVQAGEDGEELGTIDAYKQVYQEKMAAAKETKEDLTR